MMTLDEFRTRMKKSLPPGTVLQNPGGGTRTIKSYSDRNGSGVSTIGVAVEALLAVYQHFHGVQVTSRDLKVHAPAVFDSSARPAGHSCNCTFLFMVLERLGLADPIQGDGVSGRPFYTTFR